MSELPVGSPTPNEPPQVPKPAAPLAPVANTSMDRRRFLSWMGLAWVSFAAATGGALSIVLRYLFPNVVFEPPTTFKAGIPSDYEIGIVDERWKEKFGVWMIKTAEGMYALSTICTHL